MTCTTAITSTLDSSLVWLLDSKLAIGKDGLGLISYAGSYEAGVLRVAHCQDVLCTRAITTTLDASGHVGIGSGIAIGPDGLGIILYHEDIVGGTPFWQGLKLAHCENVACTQASLFTVDLDNVKLVGGLALGPEGLLISYSGIDPSDRPGGLQASLRVAYCTDSFCSRLHLQKTYLYLPLVFKNQSGTAVIPW